MILSRYSLRNIDTSLVTVPDEALLALPEKVLQFGTGVLLRGLPDYFIDKANRQGRFNGRIVVVKSTAQGDTLAFEKQDGLYTLCVRGIEGGTKVEENIVNASISRVLSAAEEWKEVLACAHNPHLQLVVSNTTEVGIQLVHEDIRQHPPGSFPGKLLAFLYERFRAFEGTDASGMVIVPTELITDNGKKLEAIVLELAHLNNLEDRFIEWLERCNHFCNSLVDRIVPGRPDADTLRSLEAELGYKDELLTVSEAYRLWAIEGGEVVKEILSFAGADAGVVITDDIGSYRELKLRLLNGTHTLSCGVAFLAGCDTVQQAMNDAAMSAYISALMLTEIAPSIPYPLDAAAAQAFAGKVLDRFRNPHIRHHWLSITLNYTSKIKLRCLPLLLKHYENNTQPPHLFATGFAAYLYFMKAVVRREGKFYGRFNETDYLIQDEAAESFYRRWSALSLPTLVSEVLGDTSLWETSLLALPGFYGAVLDQLGIIQQQGMKEALENLPLKVAAA